MTGLPVSSLRNGLGFMGNIEDILNDEFEGRFKEEICPASQRLFCFLRGCVDLLSFRSCANCGGKFEVAFH